MTLTEQWEKGELESGWYYIEEINGDVQIDYYDVACADYEFNELEGDWDNFGETIKEVLAPVPNYGDWKRIIDDWRDVSYENKKLKKLLKECRYIMNIEKDFASCHFEKHKLNELLTKIDEVLK